MPRFQRPTDDALRALIKRLGTVYGSLAPNFVYGIECCEFTKIGHAAAPVARRTAFQIASPFEVRLMFKFRTHHIGARVIEQVMHGHFRPTHHRGEWFRLEPGALSKLKPEMIGLASRAQRLWTDMVLSDDECRELHEQTRLFARREIGPNSPLNGGEVGDTAPVAGLLSPVNIGQTACQE